MNKNPTGSVNSSDEASETLPEQETTCRPLRAILPTIKLMSVFIQFYHFQIQRKKVNVNRKTKRPALKPVIITFWCKKKENAEKILKKSKKTSERINIKEKEREK